MGGFLGLELPVAASPAASRDARWLASGRACIVAIVRHSRARSVLLPAYVCDAVVDAVRAAGCTARFYGIGADFAPRELPDPERDELVLIVDFFGVSGRQMHGWAARLGQRLLVDNSQAFFAVAPPEAWSFNSARKFFGVPDGACLDGPHASGLELTPAVGEPSIEHLVLRAVGDRETAYQAFLRAEQGVRSEPLEGSALSRRLLAALDLTSIRRKRRENFEAYARVLGGLNRLSPTLDPDAVPHSYPFLPPLPIAHRALAERGLFVPRFWPEVLERPEAGALERDLAAHCLPLPLDQRYGPEQCSAAAELVRSLA